MADWPTLSSDPELLTAPDGSVLLAFDGTHSTTTGDPLDGLILIMLSQATNDINCDRAFRSLKEAFPSWDEALAALGAQADHTAIDEFVSGKRGS